MKRQYLFCFIILLVTELIIAFFVNDTFIRPFVGDFLVVILLFFGIKSVVYYNSIILALGVLIFAFVVEGLQASGLIYRLGLENNFLARLILGTSFAIGDLFAYALGIVVALGLDNYLKLRSA